MVATDILRLEVWLTDSEGRIDPAHKVIHAGKKGVYTNESLAHLIQVQELLKEVGLYLEGRIHNLSRQQASDHQLQSTPVVGPLAETERSG